MSKKRKLEDRMYTADEVDALIDKEFAEARERRDKVVARYVGESSRMLHAMIELDVSYDTIVALHDTELLRKKGFTKKYIKELKLKHWQKQMEKKE